MATVAVPSPYTNRIAEAPEFDGTLERFPRRPYVEEVRKLSKVNGWRSTFFIFMHWSIVLVAGYLAVHSGHWAVYIMAGFVIATRQQALGVLMHDSVHYLLYKNRTINDVVCDLFIAFPIGMSNDLYRGTHFRHHLYTGSPDDPDLRYQKEDTDWFVWPKSRAACAWIILKSILGLNLNKAVTPYRMWSPWLNITLPLNDKPRFPLRSRILLVVSTAVMYAVVFYNHLIIPVLLLWMIPGLTVLNLVNRLRTTAEHLGVPSTHELNATRTVVPTWWERLIVTPHNVSYHIEHHLFPSVPGPVLHKLHRVLMNDPQFRDHAHVTYSYVGVLDELMALEPPVNDDSKDRSAIEQETIAAHERD